MTEDEADAEIKSLISEILLEFAFELFSEDTLLDIKNSIDSHIAPDECSVKLNDEVLTIVVINEQGPKYKLQARIRP